MTINPLAVGLAIAGRLFHSARQCGALIALSIAPVFGATTLTLNHVIADGTTRDVSNNDSLTLLTGGAGTMINNGQLRLLGSNATTDLVISGGTATFSGSGALTLSNFSNNRIYGASSSDRLFNSSGHTIRGSGQIGANQMALTNEGLIVADQGTGLVIDPGGSGAINRGTMRATSGAVLTLQGGVFTNTDGTIEATDATTASRVDISAATISGGTLATNSNGIIRTLNGATLSSVTISSGSKVEHLNAHTLNLSGTIQNLGALQLAATTSQTDIVANSTGVTFDGNGSVILSSTGNGRFYGATSTTTLTNLNNTISGAGQLGANQLQLDNRALIDANVSGTTLTIDPSGSGVTNTGTLRASGGGRLLLQGGTFTNTSGSIDAQSGSFVDLSSANVVGGSLSAASGTAVRAMGGSTLNAVTITTGSNLQFSNATSNTLAGTITNNGTLTLNSTSNTTDLIIDSAGVTLTGGGNLVLSAFNANRLYGDASTTTLTNQNNVIRGGGSLGANQLQLVNQASGIIEASEIAADLTIDPSGTGVANSGTMRAVGGAKLVLNSGTFTNTGGLIEAQDDSVVQANSATLVGGNLATVADGAIRASGSTFNGVTLTSGSNLEFSNASTNHLVGTYTNIGKSKIASAANTTDVILNSAGVTFAGGGEFTLSSSTARLYGATSTTTLINENNIVRGAGNLGANQLQIDNRHLIEANNPGAALIIDPSGSGVANSGTLRASGGATLHLDGGTYANTAIGRIEAATGSLVEFDGASISGGILAGSGTGIFRNVNGSTLRDLAIASGTTIENANAATLNLAGTITNSGTLAMKSTANTTDVILNSAGVTLNGGGVLTLAANSRLYGATGTTLLTIQNQTIRGRGEVGANQLAIQNHGLIEANIGGATLVLNPSGSGLANAATLDAVNGGVLQLNSGVFANSYFDGTTTIQGLIRAQTGSTLDIVSSTVTGGTVDVGPSATLKLNAASVTGGTLALSTNANVTTTGGVSTVGGQFANPSTGTITVGNATTLRLLGGGSYTNNGALNVAGGANTTDFIVSGGNVTIGGTGTLTLSSTGTSRIYGASGTDRLINNGNTIQGSGTIGANQMGFTNAGTVIANQANVLSIDPSSGVTNTGTLRADGGTLRLASGTYTNTGGRIEAKSGSVVQLNGATIGGGTYGSENGGLIRNTGSATLTDFTLETGGVLEGANATSTTLGGAIANQGTLRIAADANTTDYIIASGGATLTGGGVVALSDSHNNRLYGANGSTTLVNQNNTIRGSGQLGAGQLQIDNRATIEADQPTALTIDPSGTGVANSGTLRASNGATLKLQNGAFSNSSAGRIEAASPSARIQFSNATITGGTLASVSGASLQNLGSSTFADFKLLNDSLLEIVNASTATLHGAVDNSGTISVQASANTTDLIVGTGGLTLNGNGTLLLSNNGNNRVYGASGTTVLHNASNTIRGAGQFGAGQLTFTNTGIVEADQATAMTMNFTANFTNQGTLRATGAGGIVYQDAILTNAGSIEIGHASKLLASGQFLQTSGATKLRGSAFLSGTSHNFQAGALAGTGAINGPVTSSAIIAPGDGTTHDGAGIGTLTFNHSLTLTSTSLLKIDIGGLASFDKIQAQSAVLNGTLGVTFTNDAQLLVQPADTFTLFTTTNANGLSGTFTGLANGARIWTADGRGTFQINYAANALFLSNFEAVPEPSTYVLLGLGGIALWLAQRCRKAK